MAFRVYRPYVFPDAIDPDIVKELKRLGVRFESTLHAETDAIVCLLGVKVDAALLDQVPKLRVVSNVAVGYDNIDVAACTARGVIATNTPDVLTEATADLAWALLLAAARRVPEGDRYVRAGKWKRWDWTTLRGADVHGRTLGILGAGRIGQATGHRAVGFSMQVLYTSRERKLLFEHTTLARRVDFKTLLRESDFLSVHVSLSKETRHLIGAKELAMMKPGAILINTARGPIVDEAALVKALKSGKLASAGLDVFEHEPKLHPGLLKLENVAILPHIGSATDSARRRMVETALRNCMSALKGEMPPNAINGHALSRK
ncbi:MAG TPA: D-glycerate dehydrogenase [Planctomycetota bacterium]|nr:D-glycerate dehydrogenase [Planctomycetota bacterium]